MVPAPPHCLHRATDVPLDDEKCYFRLVPSSKRHNWFDRSISKLEDTDTTALLSLVRSFSFCNDGDPVCHGGVDLDQHLAYADNGSIEKALKKIAKCWRRSSE